MCHSASRALAELNINSFLYKKKALLHKESILSLMRHSHAVHKQFDWQISLFSYLMSWTKLSFLAKKGEFTLVHFGFRA